MNSITNVNVGGDRAALLAAINEAAGSIDAKKRRQSAVQGQAMMKTAKVHANVARDLVSSAGGDAKIIADMNDFQSPA